MTGSRTGAWLDRALVVGASAWILRSALAGAAFTVDDAYIVVRYAEHLVHHGRLAYNLGEAPVEGVTSMLGVAVAALAIVVSTSPVVALKTLGVVSAVSLPLLVREIGRELRVAAPASGLAAVSCAALAEHTLHAPSGLETEAFAALGLVLVWAAARAMRGGRAPLWAVAASAFLLIAARPEGLPAAGAVLGLVLRRRGRDGALPLALGFVLPLALLTAFRVAVFGALLPNTFHAKAGPASLRLPASLLSLAVDMLLGALVCAVLLALVARISGLTRRRTSPRMPLLVGSAIFVLAALAVAYARSVAIMDYGRRFAFHGLAPLTVVSLALYDHAVRTACRLDRSAGRAAAALLTLAGATTVARGQARAAVVSAHRDNAVAGARTLYAPASAWIAEHVPRNALLAVYPDGGLVPLATGLRTVDFGRLNDAYLGRTARSPAEVAAYFFAREPDVLLLASPAPRMFFDPGAEAILRDGRFFEHYVLGERFEYRGVALDVYTRRR